MNPDLKTLQPYPFEKLRALKSGVEPPPGLSHINLSVGEPKHPAPEFVRQALVNHLDHLSTYPGTKGLPALRASIARWLQRRFQLTGALMPDTQVLPVNGTREALFAFAQAVIRRNNHGGNDRPAVLMPNPFYQIYEGAALLAGAEPVYLNCTPETGFLPDFDAVPVATWQRCQLLYLCSPGNPTGAVLGMARLQALIELADRHDFIIASDECYSEIYPEEDQPPVGLLQACAAMGRHDYHRCVVFHSLSKRSNLPGLRSGFVAGDAGVLEPFLLYRTYHGCAMPVQHQQASIAAWDDEQHVSDNRALYREKLRTVIDILGSTMELRQPDAGFYLWAKTPTSDTEFSRQLFAEQHLSVVPGSFLGRDCGSGNPGADRVRMALVAPLDQCIEGAQRIKTLIESL